MTNYEAIERIRKHIFIHRLQEPHALKIHDALTMAIRALERNTKLGVIESENELTGLPVTHCPSCGKQIDMFLYGRPDDRVDYCMFCGQAVRWD